MTMPNIESASHVTDEEAKRVCLFAVNMGEALGLPRYQYSVMVEPCDDRALASIHMVRDRHIAELSLSKEWMERTEEERMNSIVHEVLHLIHRDVDYMVERFESLTHAHEFEGVWSMYRRETELMVDYLATFMSDFTTIQAGWASSIKEARKALKK